MSEISVEGERGSWNVSRDWIEIEYSLGVLAEIDRTVIEGFNRLRRGGMELRSVLFGERDERTIRILTFRPLSCEHVLGPNFVLSKTVEVALSDLLDSS